MSRKSMKPIALLALIMILLNITLTSSYAAAGDFDLSEEASGGEDPAGSTELAPADPNGPELYDSNTGALIGGTQSGPSMANPTASNGGTSPTTPTTPTTPASSPSGGAPKITGIRLENPLGANTTIIGVLQKVFKTMQTIMFVVVPIFVVVGAFQMMFASGNPEDFKKGQKTILYSVIGLVIILIANGIVAIVQSILTV